MQNKTISTSANNTIAPPPRRGDDLSERLLELAARAGKLVDALPDTRLGRHFAGQLVRAATSPAPNYEEARGAESKRDFVHKLAICLKEHRESCCWLRLIIKTELLSSSQVSNLLGECQELCAIIAKSIVTAKSRKEA